MDCIFCTNKIHQHSFLESKNFIAIYNIAPILPGHSLIIPKVHSTSFMELSNELLSELSVFSKKATSLLQKAFNTKDFNWTIQDGESAGQTLMHLHLHIIPRKHKDLPNPGDWYPKLKKEFYSENIDSELRIKLNDKEHKQIIDHLRKLASH